MVAMSPELFRSAAKVIEKAKNDPEMELLWNEKRRNGVLERIIENWLDNTTEAYSRTILLYIILLRDTL